MSLDYWEGAVSDSGRHHPRCLAGRVVGGGWRALQPQHPQRGMWLGSVQRLTEVCAACSFLPFLPEETAATSVLVGSCSSSSALVCSSNKCDLSPSGFLFSEKCMHMQNLGRLSWISDTVKLRSSLDLSPALSFCPMLMCLRNWVLSSFLFFFFLL